MLKIDDLLHFFHGGLNEESHEILLLPENGNLLHHFSWAYSSTNSKTKFIFFPAYG